MDFQYEIDGEVYRYSIAGEGSIKLSELFGALGIAVDVADVETVAFSTPDYLAVSGPEADGDWTLESLAPFDTEEELAVTLRDGEAFTIKVTDEQLTGSVLTAAGETYEITVDYDEDAGIPAGAKLKVKEITSKNSAYASYLAQALDAANGTDSSYTRFFDIEIWAEGRAIEPKSNVEVTMKLLDAPQSIDSIMSVVHFAKSGVEVLDATESAASGIIKDGSTGETDLVFASDEFSIYGVITTAPSDAWSGNEYMVLVKQGNDYYLIKNDGKLEAVTYNEGDGTVTVENPMLWTYRDGHIYHDSTQVGFTNQDLPSDSYYRYIDPSSTTGLNEDDATNTTTDGTLTGQGAGPKITNRSLWPTTALTYTDSKLRSSSNNNYYLGVSGSGSSLKLQGQASSADAATIVFATAANVAPPWWERNAVNHIDISIKGTTEADVPLAYGKYYDADHNLVKEVTSFEKLHLSAEQVADPDQLVVTANDMKSGTITAYLKNGQTLDNAFYVSGYSENPVHEASTAQVRIEGSFKVANIPDVDVNRYNNDPSYKASVHAARKDPDNRVYYSVTVIKPIVFNLQMDDPENPDQKIQLYDADGKPLTVTANIAFSASFDYWDERNECPPIKDAFYGYHDEWLDGGIPNHNMSGMDFKLGANTSGGVGVYAVEITKIVVDEKGNRIKSNDAGTTSFNIYRNSDATADSVKDLNVGEARETPDYSGYSLQHTKSINVGSEGLGLVYDYDVTPGMYYVSEDPSSIKQEITDTSGQTWDYKETYFLTEYAWRNHENDNYMHVSETYRNGQGSYGSVPEILGNHYGYNGTDGPYTNDFLEFYVYNVYESPKVDVPVIKTWPDFEGDEYDWRATFKLQWAPLYEGESKPSSSFLDVTPEQTMVITKDDMTGLTVDLVQRYLSGDNTLTPAEIEKVEKVTFTNLPKYGTDANGDTYRIQYSLDEISYRVTDSTTGVVINSWDESNGYSDPDETTHYQPFYPHDAGETVSGNTDEQNEGNANYYVEVSNHPRRISEKEYIDVALTKQWDSSFAARDDSYYAVFELKRFAHTEYRDLSHMTDEDMAADPITITIMSGSEVVHTLQVLPDVGLYLGGNFAPHTEAKSVTFTADHPVRLANDSRTTTITATAAGSNMSNALVRSPEFFVTEDTVFHITSGEENLVAGEGRAKVLDTAAGTVPLPDKSYSQTIRLDNTNNWTVDLPDLIRSETSAGDEDDNENVTFYEYYFVEVESNPNGIAQYFRADEHGQPTQVLSGDSDHQIETNESVVAVNGPSNRLVVKKYWRGVPDTTGFPEVTFTLYQAWADGNDGWVYQNETTGAKYEHVSLKGNLFEWICPEELPTTRLDNGRSRAVKYYVVEDVRSGSQTEGSITTSWQFYYYLSSTGETTRQTNAGHQGYFAPVTGAELAANGGTITICNKMDRYMQLDIQKQYFELRDAGSWYNITSDLTNRWKNTILGFKVIRAIKTSTGEWLDEKGNAVDEPVWSDYSDEMLCGYDGNGQAVVSRGPTDIFWLHDAGGDWHFRIEDNQGDATNVKAGGSGLPSYGYYIRNGEEIPVEYWYSCRETNVYRYVSTNPDGSLTVDEFPEWDWYSSLTPVNAYGPSGSMEAFPKAFHGQDPMRIANFQASNLIIDKEWIGDVGAQEVYVKVWRTDGNGEPEDFTAVIAEDVRNNKNWQSYVTDPSVVDVNRKCLILKGESGEDWEYTLKVNRALLGTLAETGRYTYYIQEVGYRTWTGEYRTNVNAKFKPLYDKWVGDADSGDWTNAPVGMNEYASNAIQIGEKGENRLKVINRATPSTSYTVHKAFHGKQSSTGLPSSVTDRYPTDGSKHVVVELQQRYRYEKSEGGVDYVSADNTNWVRADSAEAATTWTVDWQAAESASPVSVALPLDKPQGSILSDEAWYGSAAAWSYTWNGLDLVKVIAEDADPHNSKTAQLYYRAVEVSTPDWLNSMIAAEEQDGHKAIDDDEQTQAQINAEQNGITNERNDCDLKLNKEWTGLGTGNNWPAGYTVDYQLVQNYHLVDVTMTTIDAADSDDGLTHIVPTYSYGTTFKSVDMVRQFADGMSSDNVHTQAVRTIDSADTFNITDLPRYGFFVATADDVAAAAEKGVTLKAGTTYAVVYTYSVRETDVKKNGTSVPFKPLTVDAEVDATVTEPLTYKATLLNELVSVTVEKDWNGLEPITEDESATIGLYRFEKEPEVEPEPEPEETTFEYSVSVEGSSEALDSNGTVTVVLIDEQDQEAGRYTLQKNDWSHVFELEIGKTYHAAFAGDGNVLEAAVLPSTASDITAAGSVSLTATVKQQTPPDEGTTTGSFDGGPNCSNYWGVDNWNGLKVGQAYTLTFQTNTSPTSWTVNGTGVSRLSYTIAGDWGSGGQISVTFVPESEGVPVVITASDAASARSMKSKLATSAKLLAAGPLRSPAQITWSNDASTLPTGANPTTDEKVDEVTLSGTTWSKTWDELPKYSDDGKEYVYYAYELDYTGATGATDMATSYSVDNDGKLIVTNTPTYPQSGNLKVEKEVFYGDVIDPGASNLSFTVGVFTDAAGTTRAQDAEGTEVADQVINVTNGKGEVTFTGLAPATYYVFEIVDGSPVTASGTTATIDGLTYAVTYEGVPAEVVSGDTVTAKVVNTKDRYELNIVKEDETDTTKKLNGAVFVMHELVVDADTGDISYADETGTTVTTSGTGADAGKAVFDDLALGYYEIKETVAPTGYVLPDDVIFYIHVTGEGVTMVEREDGKLPDEWQAIQEQDPVTFTAQSSVYTATVGNTPGAELPHAGGIGTTVFMLIGAMLMGGAAAALLHRRTL